MQLLNHQTDVLNDTENLNRVAYYLDMGLGKTYVGAEKMVRLGAKINLIVCQKSKIDDWIDHFRQNYGFLVIWNLTDKTEFQLFFDFAEHSTYTQIIGVINYELAYRRPRIKALKNFTLMLDESSMIQNENAKRSRFILALNPQNVILLSGTPTSGKYENLWSQCRLLGWNIPKKMYWKNYIDTEVLTNEGYPITIVKGYKNVDRLKRKLREYGAVFMKTEEVISLPEQIEQTIRIPTTPEYRKFRRNKIIVIDELNLIEFHDESDFYGNDVTPRRELVGDTTLTKMLYERMLCGQYNREKLGAFKDLLESTEDRLIVFYNFDAELDCLCNLVDGVNRPYSIINGKEKDLDAYKYADDSVTFAQYQAGAMGHNLQLANKIVYFTPPLSSEMFEQSKKRTHRIGQKRTCFYYYLTCRNSIEEKIYKTLAMRRDYTNALFEEEDYGGRKEF